MTHEPECEPAHPDISTCVLCKELRCCICRALRAAYTRGYNDHATSAQHWQDTHGAYRQHGAGENP